jgi:uncharacterized protein YbcI
MKTTPDQSADSPSRRSQGEIEAAVCDAISRFQQEYMGRGPQHVHTHLIDNMLFVKLQGVLTAAEQRLMELRDDDNGRGAEIVKQFRSHLVTTGRRTLERLVQDVTGTPTVNLHHDISAETGEEVIVFTLASPPACRDRRRKT